MTGRDLASLLEAATEHLPDVDLADQAWAAALAHRRRRLRWLLGGVAAAGALALVVTAGLGQDRRPEPDVSPPPVTTSRPPAMDRSPDGTLLVQAPRAADETHLPLLPSPLPGQIRLDQPTPALSSLAGPERAAFTRVSAAYLRQEGQALLPVLVAADGTQAHAGLRLSAPAGDAPGDPPAISPDGRTVAFAQPGEVVLLELPSGQVRRLPVADRQLTRVGWTAGATGLVARSSTRAWFVDPGGGASRALPEPAAPSHYELVTGQATGQATDGGIEPRPALLTWDAYGRRVGRTEISVPVAQVHGNTSANIEGWAAAGVSVDPARLDPRMPHYGGLLVVQADQPSSRRLLVFAERPDGLRPECCRPLGWLSGQEVLFVGTGTQEAWLLAWNVASGQVSRVSKLTGAPPGAPVRLAVRVP